MVSPEGMSPESGGETVASRQSLVLSPEGISSESGGVTVASRQSGGFLTSYLPSIPPQSPVPRPESILGLIFWLI